VRRVAERLDRIRAQKRELLARPELVPELLETDRRVAVPLRPEERHHLTERVDLRRALARLSDQRPDHVVEPRGVRPAVDHEPVEGGACVERHVPALRSRTHDVEAADSEALRNALPVRWGRDQDPGVGGTESRSDVLRDAVEEIRLALVELDGMAVYGEFDGQVLPHQAAASQVACLLHNAAMASGCR
jgi:hypothetical protein